ncbi:MAG TPA: heme exporter protein CcmD [Chloroflexota bacterium]|jgi:hypothetical protein|nr:heme exporter protein CcmD [Chloroflexota bacterium]
MLGLDQNGGYVLSAFGITVLVLGGYALYLRSRLQALRRRARQTHEVHSAAEQPTLSASPSEGGLVP